MATWRATRYAHYRAATLSRQRSVAAAFTPTDLGASLAAWYDANDITTLFQDSAGTTPVTADNDPVGKMNDKSGNARHLLQATAGFRPLYKTAVVGSKAALRLDGVDDLMTAAVSGWPEQAPFYIAAVLMARVSGSVLRAFGSFTGSKGWQFGQGPAGLTGGLTTLGVENLESTAAMFVAGTPAYVSVEFTAVTFDAKFRKNGSALGTTVDGTADTNAGVTDISLGANPPGSFFWDGDVAEVVALGRAPTAAEITNVESYYATKYGI